MDTELTAREVIYLTLLKELGYDLMVSANVEEVEDYINLKVDAILEDLRKNCYHIISLKE